MRKPGLCMLLAALLWSGSAPAAEPLSEELRAETTSKGIDLLAQGKPAEAVAAVDPVLASFDAQYPAGEKQVFCANGMEQTLAVLLIASAGNKESIALAPTWCDALFTKGFALVDLQRLDEAGPYLQKAAEMAPLNAHYINEYAEWHKAKRHWQTAYDLFDKARSVIFYAPDAFKKPHEARSLRGMGFALIELGKLDEAEKMFKKSLKLMPGHPSALSELQYIKDLRKTKPSA